MAAIPLAEQPSLGTIVHSFPKVQYDYIKSLRDRLNSITVNAGVITATSGVFTTGTFTSATIGTLTSNTIKQNTLTALNSTGTITAAMLVGGGISSTSAAGVTATLDTVANIAATLGAVQGTVLDFIVDNTSGASVVTIAVVSGIVAAKQVSSGDTAVSTLLAVTNGSTTGLAQFRLIFSSSSTATIYRVC